MKGVLYLQCLLIKVITIGYCTELLNLFATFAFPFVFGLRKLVLRSVFVFVLFLFFNLTVYIRITQDMQLETRIFSSQLMLNPRTDSFCNASFSLILGLQIMFSFCNFPLNKDAHAQRQGMLTGRQQ